MEPGRSLREVRKQYKERALAAAKVSTATPQPSPPISEADFQSSASVNAFNDAQSVTEYQEEVKEDTEKKFSEWVTKIEIYLKEYTSRNVRSSSRLITFACSVKVNSTQFEPRV